MLHHRSTPGKVIFIAMPSMGAVNSESAVTGRLNEVVYKSIANFHVKNPNFTFVSPMVQDYNILAHMGKDPVWAVWQNHCRRLIERCDEVWVLMLDGWCNPNHKRDAVYNTSEGVAAEIEHAYSCEKIIRFIMPIQE